MAPHFITGKITAMAPSALRKLMLIGRDRSTDAIDAKRLAPGSARTSSPGLGANVVRCKAGCGVFVETGYTWGSFWALTEKKIS